MAALDTIVELKASKEAEKAAVEAELSKFDKLSQEVQDEKAAELERGKVIGWDEYAAQNQVPVDQKVYTEQQWQDEVVPRDEKIKAQELEIASLKEQLEALKPAAEELAAMKTQVADIQAKFDEYKAANIAQAQS